MNKIYAVFVCFCKYTSGYAIHSTHKSLEDALRASKTITTSSYGGIDIISFNSFNFVCSDEKTFKVECTIKSL